MFLKLIIVFLVSMVPLIELRGAVPIGVGFGIPEWLVCIIAMIGNFIPVPFIFVFARRFLEWGSERKWKSFSKLCKWCLKKGEKELLASPAKFTCWRAPTDNDMYDKARWNEQYIRYAAFNVNKTEVNEYDSSVILSGTFCGPARMPLYELDVRFAAENDGLTVNVSARRTNEWKINQLPRFALAMDLVPGFEDIEYFGRGKECNYSDIKNHTFLGVYESKVSDEYIPFMRPQEHGNHTECEYVSLCDGENVLRVDSENFEFSALHCSMDSLTDTTHYFDLEMSDDTYLLINYKVGGIGSNSCGPKPAKQYLFNDDSFDFDFSIKVDRK